MRRWFDRFRRLPSEDEFTEELRSHLAHVIDEQVERGVERRRRATPRSASSAT